MALLAAAALALGATTVAAGTAHALTPRDTAPTAYVVNSVSRTLSEIDTATGAVTGTVALQRREGLGIEMTEQVAAPGGKQIYVLDRRSDDISVIDTATDETSRLFRPCRGLHEDLLFTPDGSKAFAICTVGNSWSVVEIDTRTHVSVPVPGLAGSNALAVSPTAPSSTGPPTTVSWSSTSPPERSRPPSPPRGWPAR
ncbi:hypothetical protein GXW82_01260 [Streptacidiphilus sp. 4-A2]|nr:hypothetical protein [Streptacidiphilus sp. 4-A2]